MQIPFFSLVESNLPLKQKFLDVFNRVVDQNDYILGADLERFEKSFSKFCDSNYCIGVGNGFDALKIALISLGIQAGDEVIVPAHTFIATWFAVSAIGAKPVPVEVKLDTMNLDPHLIVAKITSNTKAIIPVHLYGQMCEMNPIVEIAKAHNLFIIEDFAQAHGALYNGNKAGSYGHLNATSFYPGKNLGAMGDGGAIVGNLAKYTDKARLISNYGSCIKYEHERFGFNSRLDNLQAAFLNVKLSVLHNNNNKRRQIAEWYNESLKKNADILLQESKDNFENVYHLFVIRTKLRDQLKEHLFKNGVSTQIHYPVPIFSQKAYEHLNYSKIDFPITQSISDTCLSLPMYPDLKRKEVDYILNCIDSFFS